MATAGGARIDEVGQRTSSILFLWRRCRRRLVVVGEGGGSVLAPMAMVDGCDCWRKLLGNSK